MNNRERVCRECRIANTCHPALKPEDSDRWSIPELFDTCRHYACREGRMAATQVVASTSTRWGRYIVTERSGGRHDVLAAPFGAREKTKGWIVTNEGTIFSEQHGSFYATGQHQLET